MQDPITRDWSIGLMHMQRTVQQWDLKLHITTKILQYKDNSRPSYAYIKFSVDTKVNKS